MLFLNYFFTCHLYLLKLCNSATVFWIKKMFHNLFETHNDFFFLLKCVYIRSQIQHFENLYALLPCTVFHRKSNINIYCKIKQFFFFRNAILFSRIIQNLIQLFSLTRQTEFKYEITIWSVYKAIKYSRLLKSYWICYRYLLKFLQLATL